MKLLIQRFADTLWEEKDFVHNTAVEWYQSMVPTDDANERCWTDIDYADQTRSVWSARNHYWRILYILKAFGKQRLLSDGEYAANMVRALRFWLNRDFTNPNWWHNQIGMPEGIGNVVILMLPVLDKDTLERAIALIKRGSMSEDPNIAKRWTGANLIWFATNTIRYALLTENATLLMEAAKRASEEITIDMAEGIQQDYSFFQHGPQLYTGGYGYNFTDDLTRIMFVLQGTKFQFPAEKIRIFNTYVLDGLQHMTHKYALDWSCVGRQLTRIDSLKAENFARTLELMLNIEEMPRKQDLQDFISCIKGKPQPNKTKYFEIAAMLCHHFNGIYVGAKFLNNRTWGAEICNGEGDLCYNMSYGTHTCIMQSGDEYMNINPVWDYSRIPGTTARVETDEQLLSHRNWWRHSLPNDCFGGKQNGNRAVIYELAEHGGIQALVANFAFEDGFVCLGAEICDQSESAEPLITTVDQCFFTEKVTLEGRSVLHNGIRYSALGNTRIEFENKRKKGSWRRNNVALSDAPVSADVLTLSIVHPVGEKSEYAYMISATAQAMPKVTVLRNDAKAQAIQLPDGSVMAVFHQDCTITVNDLKLSGKAGTIVC